MRAEFVSRAIEEIRSIRDPATPRPCHAVTLLGAVPRRSLPEQSRKRVLARVRLESRGFRDGGERPVEHDRRMRDPVSHVQNA